MSATSLIGPAPWKELRWQCGHDLTWTEKTRVCVPCWTRAPRAGPLGPLCSRVPSPWPHSCSRASSPLPETAGPLPPPLSTRRASGFGRKRERPQSTCPVKTSWRPRRRDAGEIYQPLGPVKSILSKNLKNASHIQHLETTIPF